MKYDVLFRTVAKPIDLYLLKNTYLEKDVIERLKHKIEKNLIKENFGITNVKAHMTSWVQFCNDPDFKQFFKAIIPDIHRCVGPHKEVYIHNAWGNKLNEGEHHVAKHCHHQTTLICGVLHLDDNGPGLHFEDFDTTIKEVTGGYVLFHPDAWHEVKKFKYTSPRYSIAFNIHKNWYPQTR